MPVEGFKNCSQKSMSQQHSRSCDINNGDALLGSDGLEEIPAVRYAGRDSCSFTFRIPRVQYINRNVLLNRWQHSCRMQDLGSKVCQLSCFIKTDDFDPPGLRAKVGISS